MSMFLSRIVLLVAVLMGAYSYMSSRYDLLFDKQEYRCLDASVFLVDTWDKTVTRNDLIAFDFPITSGPLQKGMWVIKYVGGLPRETVHYNALGIETESGAAISSDIRAGVKLLDFQMPENGELQLDDNEYFMVGDLSYSFDSRYWGAISKRYLQGNVYEVL